MRTAAEVAVGVLYAIGAVFNTGYTLRHGEEFFGQWVDRAWLAPAGTFTARVVVPRSVMFTVGLVVFQVAVAVTILSRGEAVTLALLAGGCFSAVVAFFASPGGAVANAALAALQFSLAAAR